MLIKHIKRTRACRVLSERLIGRDSVRDRYVRAYVRYATTPLTTGREAAQNFRVFVTAAMDSWLLKEQEFVISYIIVFHSIEIPVFEIKLGKEA